MFLLLQRISKPSLSPSLHGIDISLPHMYQSKLIPYCPGPHELVGKKSSFPSASLHYYTDQVLPQSLQVSHPLNPFCLTNLTAHFPL